MPEPKIIVFSYQELAEMMIKKQNIHEGYWGVFFRFGIQGANVNIGTGEQQLLPSAIVPILEVGLQEFDGPNSLSVDAAKVNPQPKRSIKSGKPAKK